MFELSENRKTFFRANSDTFPHIKPYSIGYDSIINIFSSLHLSKIFNMYGVNIMQNKILNIYGIFVNKNVILRIYQSSTENV